MLAVYYCAATHSAEPGFAIDGGFALGERKAGDRTGGGGKMLVWRMISSSPAEHPRLGAEVDPYSETPPLALNPDRKPPLASE